MIFLYQVDKQKVAIIAQSTTIANHGLNQRYPNVSKRYLGIIDEIFQVDGNMTMDGEFAIIDEPTTEEGTDIV